MTADPVASDATTTLAGRESALREMNAAHMQRIADLVQTLALTKAELQEKEAKEVSSTSNAITAAPIRK